MEIGVIQIGNYLGGDWADIAEIGVLRQFSPENNRE
jgi:hypothetical protein